MHITLCVLGLDDSLKRVLNVASLLDVCSTQAEPSTLGDLNVVELST